ncbi:MAG: hypothetical protein Q8O67_17275 [Deltaproteobacteria bacterium]|nr:hypothetical protein [Deltaproteobacteria bacterium]
MWTHNVTSRAAAVAVACVLLGCLPDGPGVARETYPDLPAGARIELVDVAVAWPLPPGTGASDGFLGPLLDCDVVSVFEVLTRTDEPADLCAALTVTAARLDPCAKANIDSECRPELRLTVQPVFDGVARDAAMHVFYLVDEEPVLLAIAQLVELRLARGLDGRGVLGVHPVLNDAEGRGDVAAVIEALLESAVLDHVTEITVHGDNAAWTFEFRPFVDGVPSEGDARQQHVLSPSPTVIDISVTPTSGSDDAFDLLFDEEAAALAPLADQQAAFDRAARVEHPEFHTMDSVDCATCHLAAPARAAALARSPLTASPDAFTSERHDLAASAVFANPQFIHAFAWRLNTLTINQRVVNESAISADVADARLTEEGVLK